MTEIFVKPAVDGAVVPDPVTHRPLAAAGEWKAANTYWHARLRDGDVIEAQPLAPSPLAGEGGEGGAGEGTDPPATPTPDPSPQGGGERRRRAS